DMTRTVLKGRASQEILDMYDAVLAAQKAGLEAVRAGVPGSDVHARVSDVFNDRGYKEREGQGFTHSTGHGVGLDVHERPSLGFAKDILQEGNVVTVEPGLYYPEIGGIRIEDLVVVTDKGCRNLTDFNKSLVL
ncbi:MAG TPA: M24 family metallopeptidase, partial [Methanotrichaceae archaeon]|nr:M24 family metallopeptidase [Methanotrichaceae archaeon]